MLRILFVLGHLFFDLYFFIIFSNGLFQLVALEAGVGRGGGGGGLVAGGDLPVVALVVVYLALFPPFAIATAINGERDIERNSAGA